MRHHLVRIGIVAALAFGINTTLALGEVSAGIATPAALNFGSVALGRSVTTSESFAAPAGSFIAYFVGFSTHSEFTAEQTCSTPCTFFVTFHPDALGAVMSRLSAEVCQGFAAFDRCQSESVDVSGVGATLASLTPKTRAVVPAATHKVIAPVAKLTKALVKPTVRVSGTAVGSTLLHLANLRH